MIYNKRLSVKELISIFLINGSKNERESKFGGQMWLCGCFKYGSSNALKAAFLNLSIYLQAPLKKPKWSYLPHTYTIWDTIYVYKMLLNCLNATWSRFVYVYIELQIKYVPHDFWNSRLPLSYTRQVVSLFALICHKILMDRWERKKTFYLCGLIKSFALITPSCLPRR